MRQLPCVPLALSNICILLQIDILRVKAIYMHHFNNSHLDVCYFKLHFPVRIHKSFQWWKNALGLTKIKITFCKNKTSSQLWVFLTFSTAIEDHQEGIQISQLQYIWFVSEWQMRVFSSIFYVQLAQKVAIQMAHDDCTTMRKQYLDCFSRILCLRDCQNSLLFLSYELWMFK